MLAELCVLLATAPAVLRAEPPPPSEIVGGTPTLEGEFDGVVAIVAGQGLCTGTVVDQGLVLTAGHCLVGVDSPAQITVFFGDQIDMQNQVGVTDFGVHPEFCASCKDDIFDYGYVTLAADFNVPGGFLLPITTQEEWDETIGVGGAVTLVGYGEDPEAGGLDHGIGTKRKVVTAISKLSPAGFEFFAGGDNKDSCQGDSGGPAFVKLVSGEWRLAGITSRGSSPCGDGGFYGAPYPALEWVREQTEIDMCGAQCPACDCVDTAPPAPKDDCSVAGDRPAALVGILVGLALWVRRRRPTR